MKKLCLAVLTCVLCLFMIVATSGTTQSVSAAPSTTKQYSAKSYCLMAEDGQVLTENNSSERLPIASMTKVMSLNLIFEALERGDIKLDEIVVASETAAGMGGSQVFLEAGGEYKVDDLIKSIVVSSANDATVLMAERLAGSEQNFVDKMNAKALELGLKNTNYKNATGLPAADHYSSALDSAKVFKELLGHKAYFNYSQIWMDKIEHPKGRETELANTNKLLKQYSFCDAGKTGSTSEAGFCMSASAVKNDMRLIAVVIGSKSSTDRFNKTKELFNYGFDNFEKSVIVETDKKFNIGLENGKVRNFVAKAEDGFVSIVKKGENNQIETKVIINKSTAPIKRDEAVGEILCTKNGEVIKTIRLIATESVDELGYYDYLQKALENYFF